MTLRKLTGYTLVSSIFIVIWLAHGLESGFVVASLTMGGAFLIAGVAWLGVWLISDD